MIVTISNEYGTGALAIAHAVADALGYEFVDTQLPVVVAKRLNVTPDDVEANEDTARSLGERLLDSLERATPEVAESSQGRPFDAEMLGAVQEAVREYASHGNVVIVGRGAHAILGARPDVLRVFMYAPRDWRVAHVSGAGIDRKTAEAECDRVDRARRDYLQQWYGVKFGDRANHDLCLDTSRFSPEAAADLIISAARSSGA